MPRAWSSFAWSAITPGILSLAQCTLQVHGASCGGAVSSDPTDSGVDSADSGIVDADSGDIQVADDAIAGTHASIALGGDHSCAVEKDRKVFCWGENVEGGLGDGTRTDRFRPTFVPGVVAVEVALGIRHTCARLLVGTVACWGSNEWGQLGDGSFGSDARKLVPTMVPGLSGVAQIALGAHSCARKTDGTMMCWGGNMLGAIGDGTDVDRIVPTRVNLSPVGSMAMTLGAHSCAQKVDRSVYCWGSNGFGEVGDGTTDLRLAPVPLASLVAVEEIVLGLSHSCVRRSEGTVLCWGLNYRGMLGVGDEGARLSPTPVPGLTGVVQLALGWHHTCARKGDGTVLCWGANEHGQLGFGEFADYKTTPTVVPGLSGVVQIAAGSEHTCARRTDGGIVCWGYNSFGQLGDDTGVDRFAPTPVKW